MIIRVSVIGLLVSGLVSFGTGADAATLNDRHAQGKRPRPQPVRQHVTVNVYGCNNVVATDGSMQVVGDRSRVTANTGDISSGGTLGVGIDRSSLSSGAGPAGTAGGPTAHARPAGRLPQDAPAHQPAPNAQRARTAERARTGATAQPEPPMAAGPPAQAPGPAPGQDRGMSVSGYENHSVRVTGEGHVAAYDDSNLFVDRDGNLNANTGDTDSSGLNAVDVTGSTVGSGTHTEEAEESDAPADRLATAGARWADLPPTSAGRRPPANRQAASTATDGGESSSSGGSALTIGADGFDDLGVDVEGTRNTAVYDDSNVVIGGTGDVNAQVGDSDTSGAVVMGIDSSDLRSGDST